MDVVIDTNIIRGENFLRSAKFSALVDYLNKTDSYLILPQIVREESISLYKGKVSEQLNKFNELSRTCFSQVGTEFNIDVEKEVAAFETHIQKLSDDGLLYEIPYYDNFLPDVVYRMINRKKPCNEKGQECRDAILWLSIKKFLKEDLSIAFISTNSNEFASSDKKDLNPDLRVELDRENLKLKYYLDINDFLKNHADKLNITEKWVKEKLTKIDLNSLIIDYFIIHDSFLKRLAESTTVINCIDAFPNILFVEIENFYVYEMTNCDIYLNLILNVDMEIESEFEEIGTKIFNSQAHIEISGKIIEKEIKELEIVDAYQGKRAKSYKEKYHGREGKDIIRNTKGRIIDCNLIHPDCEDDRCSDCGILIRDKR